MISKYKQSFMRLNTICNKMQNKVNFKHFTSKMSDINVLITKLDILSMSLTDII